MRASKVWLIWRFLLSLKEVSLERLRAAWRYLLLGMGRTEKGNRDVEWEGKERNMECRRMHGYPDAWIRRLLTCSQSEKNLYINMQPSC